MRSPTCRRRTNRTTSRASRSRRSRTRSAFLAGSTRIPASRPRITFPERRIIDMQIPLQITLRNISKSEAVQAATRKKAAKLERFHRRIVSCRVGVETPSRHKHQGKEFVVRIDIKVPGSEIVVNHDHHVDLYVAL